MVPLSAWQWDLLSNVARSGMATEAKGPEAAIKAEEKALGTPNISVP